MATLILWIIILAIIFLPGRKKKKKQKEEQRTQGTARANYRDPRQSDYGKSRDQSYEQSGERRKKRGIGFGSRWDQEGAGSSAITFSGLPEGTDELEYLIRRNRAHERALMDRLESRDK